MKKTVIAALIVAVVLLSGVSVYALQGLDGKKSSYIIANDGYATLTASTFGGDISVAAADLKRAAGNEFPGLHVTDNYAIFSMDAAFVNSLADAASDGVVNFQFRYNSAETQITLTVRDGAGKDIFGTVGRCIGELPYKAAAADAAFVTVNGPGNKPVALSGYYPDAGVVRFRLTAGGTYAVAVNKVTFNDMTKHWAKNNVDFLAARKVASGMSASSFGPNGNVTRAQFVMFLAQISMDDIAKFNSTKFKDVPNNKWFYHAVSWAVEKGITSGISAEYFAPESKVTREQMAQLTKRYLDYAGVEQKNVRADAAFKDQDKVSSWAKEGVTACQKTAVISGYPEGDFRPAGNATRAEAATICARIISYALILPQ